MNVFGILDRSARSHYGDRTAIEFDGRAVSFRALRDRALGLAAGLAREGVGRGDRVAVLMGNRHEWPEVFFGLAALGAVCVPVNALLTATEIGHICTDSDVETLMVDGLGERALSELNPLPSRIVRVGEVEVPSAVRAIDYESLVSGVLRPGGDPQIFDPFVHYYSSGTTGLPKGAVHSHNGVLWNTAGQVRDLAIGERTRYLVVPSLAWAAGFHNVMLGALWTGGTSVLMRTGGLTADRLVADIGASDITDVMMVPSILRLLAAEPLLLDQLRASRLRRILTGAEPVPLPLIEQLSEELPDCAVVQGYGLSEFPTIATLLQPEEARSHSGSAGRPLCHSDLQVLSAEGERLDSGTGELLIRSPATMLRYHNRPEESAQTLADGWLHTGDLVTIDEAGFVTVVGRTKDLIISGGMNVYPKEVEDVIGRLTFVAEVAVVGIPDERFGEAAVAYVVATEGTTIDRAAIEATCARALARYKRPAQVIAHDGPLPRNATGKVLKRELRALARATLTSK